MPERVGVICPSASFPNVCFTRSATMLRPVVGVMGLIFLLVPLSWRAKRVGEWSVVYAAKDGLCNISIARI